MCGIYRSLSLSAPVCSKPLGSGRRKNWSRICLRMCSFAADSRLQMARASTKSSTISGGEARECGPGYASFLGAGVYRHYRPVLVDTVVSRGEFLTSYTPYQAEIAQGTLTSIFEFQTMICQLTGMDVANASMYDGSSAVPEAAMMAARITGRDHILVARTVHPEYREVLGTYTRFQGMPVETLLADLTGNWIWRTWKPS